MQVVMVTCKFNGVWLHRSVYSQIVQIHGVYEYAFNNSLVQSNLNHLNQRIRNSKTLAFYLEWKAGGWFGHVRDALSELKGQVHLHRPLDIYTTLTSTLPSRLGL